MSGFRGRLHLSRQVRQPQHRAHLLHVQYDEHRPDRPETRLVRLSLERIQRTTALDASQRLARELLLALCSRCPGRNLKRFHTVQNCPAPAFTGSSRALFCCLLMLHLCWKGGNVHMYGGCRSQAPAEAST